MRKIIIFLFCFISMSFQDMEIMPSVESEAETCSNTFLKEELNDSTLYEALVYYKVKHPRIVLAQAKLESGNFTSEYCINRNNFLGLYNSKKGAYYSFKHWTDCIQAYKEMVEYKHRDGEDYYDFLIRIKYASDPEYIDKVKLIEKELRDERS